MALPLHRCLAYGCNLHRMPLTRAPAAWGISFARNGLGPPAAPALNLRVAVDGSTALHSSTAGLWKAGHPFHGSARQCIR